MKVRNTTSYPTHVIQDLIPQRIKQYWNLIRIYQTKENKRTETVIIKFKSKDKIEFNKIILTHEFINQYLYQYK